MNDKVTQYLEDLVQAELKLVRDRGKIGWYDKLPDEEQVTLKVWHKAAGKRSKYQYAVCKYGPIAKKYVTEQVNSHYLEMVGEILESIEA